MKDNDHPICPNCGCKLRKRVRRYKKYGTFIDGVCKSCNTIYSWESNRPSNRRDPNDGGETHDDYEYDEHGRLIHVTYEE